jgi:hypothetical protein
MSDTATAASTTDVVPENLLPDSYNFSNMLTRFQTCTVGVPPGGAKINWVWDIHVETGTQLQIGSPKPGRFSIIVSRVATGSAAHAALQALFKRWSGATEHALGAAGAMAAFTYTFPGSTDNIQAVLADAWNDVLRACVPTPATRFVFTPGFDTVFVIEPKAGPFTAEPLDALTLLKCLSLEWGTTPITIAQDWLMDNMHILMAPCIRDFKMWVVTPGTETVACTIHVETVSPTGSKFWTDYRAARTLLHVTLTDPKLVGRTFMQHVLNTPRVKELKTTMLSANVAELEGDSLLLRHSALHLADVLYPKHAKFLGLKAELAFQGLIPAASSRMRARAPARGAQRTINEGKREICPDLSS